MLRIRGGHRHRGVGAQELTDAADVDDDVLAHLDAPLGDQADQVLPVLCVGAVGWVEQHEQLAALLQPGPQHVGFPGQQVRGRPGRHEHGGVGRHFAGLREDHGLHREVVEAQGIGQRAVAVALRAGGRPLAVTLQEVGLALFAFHGLDQPVGQVLLLVRDDPLDAAVVVEHHGAVRLHFILARQHRILVDVDQLQRHAIRGVLVLAEPVAVAGKVDFLGEHQHADRRFERFEHADRLVGKRVLLRRGQVPTLVLTGQDVVGGHQDGQAEHHAGGGQGAVARLPALEQAGVAAPLPEAVDHHQAQSGDERPPPQLLPFGDDEPGHHPGRNYRYARPADRSENLLHHESATPATARCRRTAR